MESLAGFLVLDFSHGSCLANLVASTSGKLCTDRSQELEQDSKIALKKCWRAPWPSFERTHLRHPYHGPWPSNFRWDAFRFRKVKLLAYEEDCAESKHGMWRYLTKEKCPKKHNKWKDVAPISSISKFTLQLNIEALWRSSLPRFLQIFQQLLHLSQRNEVSWSRGQSKFLWMCLSYPHNSPSQDSSCHAVAYHIRRYHRAKNSLQPLETTPLWTSTALSLDLQEWISTKLSSRTAVQEIDLFLGAACGDI